jgi:hypothetical protein
MIRQTVFSAGVRGSTRIVDLDRTNHLLLIGQGQQRAISEIENWLSFTMDAETEPQREANAA